MLTRRDMLRMGLIGGAAALTPAKRLFAQTSTTNGVGVSAYTTQPFMEPVPIMPVKTPVATGPGCESRLAPGYMAGPGKEHVPFEGEKCQVVMPDGFWVCSSSKRCR